MHKQIIVKSPTYRSQNVPKKGVWYKTGRLFQFGKKILVPEDCNN